MRAPTDVVQVHRHPVVLENHFIIDCLDLPRFGILGERPADSGVSSVSRYQPVHLCFYEGCHPPQHLSGSGALKRIAGKSGVLQYYTLDRDAL